jgi:glutathione S-transferase
MEYRDLYPALITIVALFVYLWNAMQCGGARAKHGVIAPATTGHPDFERKLRIQQNMLEQLMLFIPSLWIFSLTIQVLVGAALGALFIIGRIIYSLSYARDPAKRGLGFGLGILPVLILLVGSLIGVVRLLLIVN